MMTLYKHVLMSLAFLTLVLLPGVKANGASDTVAPTVKITQPSKGSTLPASEILVLGTAIDNAGGSGVKKVEVKIDNGAFELASPQVPGDWSQWSILVVITTEGSHSIKARATDNAGKVRSQTITITIISEDTVPPMITAPADISTEAAGMTTPIVTLGSPVVADNLDPSPTVTNDAPTSFSLGSTMITWTATDFSGNSATDTQSVTVSDTTPPSITAPLDVVASPTGALTPVNLGEPSVTDLVDSSVVVTNDASQGGFPAGITTVTWTAVDDFGNVGTATQMVTITDGSAPSIIAPADITIEATGSLTSVELGYPVVSDNEDPSPVLTNNAPLSGLPVGTTIVTWTATDFSGASATATQTITVVDTTPPLMIPPADVNVEVIGGLTIVALGTSAVIDLVDPLPTATNNAPSEGFMPGTHTVVWTGADTYGNSASVTQTVTLTDSTPPSVFANRGGGTYTSPQSVLLTSSETGVEIFYTIDGSDPIFTGLEYSATPLNIAVDTTLKFYAVDASGNIGAVRTEVYDIEIVTEPVVVAQDSTSTTGQSLWSWRQVHAEFAGPSSVLVGKQIDSITLRLKKVGSPTGVAEIGVINPDLSMKKTFGTIDVSQVSSSYANYEFVLLGLLYTIQANDRIGIKYTGGTGTDYLAIMRDTDMADPFDGSNTYRAQYVSSWDYFPDHDLYFILKLNKPNFSGDAIPPSITAPLDVTFQATGLLTQINLGIPTVTDNLDPSPSISNDAPSSGFPVGTTIVRWTATDATGNSAVATQNITITVPGPEGPKIYLALFLQYVDVQEQVSVYLDNIIDSDKTRLRVKDGNYLGADYISAAQSLAGDEGVTFTDKQNLVDNVQLVKDLGFEFVEFNIEPGLSPSSDTADVVGALRAAADAAHSVGLEFRAIPSKSYTTNYGVEIAPFVDYYHVQAQSLQVDPDAYEAYVKDIVIDLRATNPELVITTQVSTQQGAAPGMDKLETMKEAFRRVADDVNGLTVWFGRDDITILSDFVEWFNLTYR